MSFLSKHSSFFITTPHFHKKSPSLSQNSRICNTTKIEETALNHIIETNTKLADFPKIEQYYLNKLSSLHKTFNSNKLLIQYKQAMLSQLSSQIECALKAHYFPQTNTLLPHYNNSIAVLEHSIKLKQHNYECYCNTYSRLYKHNYLIKKRIKEEYESSVIYSSQSKQYDIINRATVKNYKHKLHILDMVNKIYDLSQVRYNKELEDKVMKLNKYDIDVFTLKNEITCAQEEIKKLGVLKGNVRKDICYRRELNGTLLKEMINIRKEYYDRKIKVSKLYKHFHIKFEDEDNITQMIYWYNNLNTVYKNNMFMFDYLNKQIQTYKFKLDQLDSDLHDIHCQIQKMKRELKHINYKTENEKMQNLILLLKTQTNHTYKTLSHKILIIDKTFMFIIHHIQEIITIINNASFKQAFDSFIKEQSICIHNKHIKKYIMHTSVFKHNVNQSEFITYVKYYLKSVGLFHYILLSIISHSFDNIVNILRKRKIFGMISQMVVYDLYGQDVVRYIKEGIIRNKMKRDNHQGILNQTQKLFLQRKLSFQVGVGNLVPACEYNNKDKSNEKEVFIMKSKTKSPCLNSVHLMQKHPRKSVAMLNKYLINKIEHYSDLAGFESKVETYKKRKETWKGNINNNISTTNESYNGNMRLKKKLRYEDYLEMSMDTIKVSNERKRKKRTRNKIKKITFTYNNINPNEYNSEIKLINSRRDDLRKFDSQSMLSSKHNIHSITGSEFSLIYQKLKTNFTRNFNHLSTKPSNFKTYIHCLSDTNLLPK